MSSGGGGNFLYLINNQVEQNYKINSLIVDRECGARLVAMENSIPVHAVNDTAGDERYFDLLSLQEVKESDLIVLAGYMPILPEAFIKLYSRPILNTHPSLLPKFGGKGMYGVKVHAAVLLSNERTTGCTCHLVDKGIDTGIIICQREILVDRSWDAWTLGGQVFALEGPNLVDGINAVKKWEKNAARV